MKTEAIVHIHARRLLWEKWAARAQALGSGQLVSDSEPDVSAEEVAQAAACSTSTARKWMATDPSLSYEWGTRPSSGSVFGHVACRVLRVPRH